MLKIKEAVIVEGKYDKIKLSSVLDALIITTEGFGIFKNRETLELIRKIAVTNGIVILTDSDSAGFMIRSYLKGTVSEGRILNAYIPDVLGKEKRKQSPSAEGKLGVEGISAEILKEALLKAGVNVGECEKGKKYMSPSRLFEDGLSGGQDSKARRKRLCKALSLPERLSSRSLIDILNLTVSEEIYEQALKTVKTTPEAEAVN